MLKKYKYEVQITCILQTIYKIYLVDEININTCLINTSINFTHILQLLLEVHELELFINFYKIYFIFVLVLCQGRSYFWSKNHSWFTWTWKEKYKGSISTLAPKTFPINILHTSLLSQSAAQPDVLHLLKAIIRYNV